MKAKSLKFFVMFMALLPSFSHLDATSTTSSGGVDPEYIIIRSTGTKPPRSIEPDCYYQDGFVFIVGDASVTSINATITRLSDNAQWSDSSTGNTLQIAVPTGSGLYRLAFSLSDGSSYYGDYTL